MMRVRITCHRNAPSGYDVGKAKFGGAVSSGVISATLSHPMDTVKTCMQGDIQRKTYGGCI